MSEHLDATDDQDPRAGRRWRRRLLLVLIPAVATAVVFACGLFAGRGLTDSAEPGGTALREPTQTVTVTAVPTPKPSPPTRLIVRSLGINAPVVDIDLGTDAVLEPPEDADLVGYWTGSAKVGAARGRTVITGHTIENGDGALDELPDLKPGAVVELASYSGLHKYRVTDNIYATYEEVAERAEDVFGQTETWPGGARLILVTCTEFNGRFYEGNSIVVAEPIAPAATPTPSATASATPTPTPTPTPSETPTETPSEDPTDAESDPTEDEPADEPSDEPTASPSQTATESASQVPPPTSSATPTPTPTPTPAPTESPSATGLLEPPSARRESLRSRARTTRD